MLYISFVFILNIFLIATTIVKGKPKQSQVKKRLLSGPPYNNKFPEWEESTYMIELCEDIYRIESGVNPRDAITSRRWRFKRWVQSVASSTEALVVQSKDVDGKIVVIFRGLEENDEWLGDISFEESKFVNAPNNVEINTSFQSALFNVTSLNVQNRITTVTKSSSIFDEVETTVLSLVGSNGEIWTVGHSLG